MKLQRSVHIAFLAGFSSALVALSGLERPDPLVSAQSVSDGFEAVSREVGPAVLSVRSFELRKGRRGEYMRQKAQGSGVLVLKDGIAATNNHVVADADEVRVSLSDGRELLAEVLGRDEDSDLAVLRVFSEEDLPFASLASDRRADIGEWVLAMGNPRGIGATVTAGIVSGIGRDDLGIAEYEDFLQTDAAINPGNSGGPLVDLDGRVLGINTAMGTRYDGTVGMGFAIPASMVQKVVDDIVESGRVRRGWLGVKMGPLVESSAKKLDYLGPSRVYISQVFENSAAERAGMKVGDLVISFNGAALEDSNDLRRAIGQASPGTEVEVVVWRDRAQKALTVLLDERNRQDV